MSWGWRQTTSGASQGRGRAPRVTIAPTRRAAPKSASLTWARAASMASRLAGVTSRCTTPAACVKDTAAPTCAATRRAASSPTPPRPTRPARSPPGASSRGSTKDEAVVKGGGKQASTKSLRVVVPRRTAFSTRRRPSDSRWWRALNTCVYHPDAKTRTSKNCRSTCAALTSCSHAPSPHSSTSSPSSSTLRASGNIMAAAGHAGGLASRPAGSSRLT
ncbi:hypothetical protein E2C01_081506 [Portunus trituberculatus]|uniref:Uncharacterized protein n=1 Tax=Portunus trituberculatus TaxID=210409 RepID=A0A5B7IPY8_PORTR|nr:hypothetical protein [Portunus trituberculatus]